VKTEVVKPRLLANCSDGAGQFVKGIVALVSTLARESGVDGRSITVSSMCQSCNAKISKWVQDIVIRMTFAANHRGR